MQALAAGDIDLTVCTLYATCPVSLLAFDACPQKAIYTFLSLFIIIVRDMDTPSSSGQPVNQLEDLTEKQLTPEMLQILMTFLRKNGLALRLLIIYIYIYIYLFI
uniref:Helicase C-terminal domain-containing protein n=1 Tax=Heterorhabditis bacteriophora TaxID=37862 RepID=A0A1I7X7F5_HETBA